MHMESPQSDIPSAERYRMPGKQFWDSKAAELFGENSDEVYAERFIELACLRPGDTVLDMGCGPGVISAFVGRDHDVVAADFSDKLLAEAGKLFAAEGVTRARTLLLDWRESWESHGITPGSFDVCLASRSLATDALADALAKLHATARRRVCLTVCANASPRVDARMIADLGVECRKEPDSLQVARMLEAWGISFEQHVLPSEKRTVFTSRADALDRCLHMLGIALGDPAEARRHTAQLIGWLDAQLSPSPEHPEALTLKRPRIITWAFFAWNKE